MISEKRAAELARAICPNEAKANLLHVITYEKLADIINAALRDHGQAVPDGCQYCGSGECLWEVTKGGRTICQPPKAMLSAAPAQDGRRFTVFNDKENDK